MEHPASILPPFTPKIPSPLSRYCEPDGPTHLAYHDELKLEQAGRRQAVRDRKPRSVAELLRAKQIKDFLDEDLQPYFERREQEDLIAAKLREVAPFAPPDVAADMTIVADKMDQCRRSGVVGMMPDGRLVKLWDSKCGETTLCPDEARVAAQRLATRYVPLVDDFLAVSPIHQVFFAVLTAKNYAPGQLAFGIAEMWRSYNELRDAILRTKAFDLQGAIPVMETPLAADGSWNIHINLILLIKGRFDYADLWRLWDKGGVYIQQIPRAGVLKAFRELIKYTTKIVPAENDQPINPKTGFAKGPPFIEWPKERVIEWFQCKYRRVRPCGCLYGADGKRWNKHDPFQAGQDMDKAKALLDQRRTWLHVAKLDTLPLPGLNLSLCTWKEIPSEHKPKLRATIARGDDPFDLDQAKWVATFEIFWSGVELTMYYDEIRKLPGHAKRVDLIPGDKSEIGPTAEYLSPPIRPGPNLGTGPPAD